MKVKKRQAVGAAVGVPAALALVLGSALTFAPAAAAESIQGGEWKTSFETGEPGVDGQIIGTPVNTRGKARAGSLTPLVVAGSVQASTDNPPNETADKLVDGDIATKWLGRANTNQWVSFEISQPKGFTKYIITSGNDAQDRDPYTFRIEGSNDRSSWTVIDRQEEVVWTARSQPKEFNLDSPSAAYKYYRFYAERVRGLGQSLIQAQELELIDTSVAPEPQPLELKIGNGPRSAINAKTNVGWTGLRAMEFSGGHLASGRADFEAYIAKDVDVLIGDDTVLQYKSNIALDGLLDYAGTYAAVDLEFSDGTRMSQYPEARDVNGYHPSSQAWGDSHLQLSAEWNAMAVDLGSQEVFHGKTVENVIFTYHNDSQPNPRRGHGTADTAFVGWFDDIYIGDSPWSKRDTSDGLVSYVDTRRGTNSDGGFSRGLNIPAATVPNGFNFYAPATSGRSENAFYAYQRANTSANRTPLQGFIISHQPSHWMGDRMQLGIMPSNLVSPNTGTTNRQLPFGHENEIARPDYYSVKLDNGMVASLAPADHSAVFRFDLGKNSGSVILDRVGAGNAVDGGAYIEVDPATNTAFGWVDHGSGLSVGRSRMFFYGEFSQPVTGVTGSGTTTAVAKFEDMTSNVVELRIATSFISRDQAKANLEMEVKGKDFEQVKFEATQEWNDVLGVIEFPNIEDVPDNKIVNTYSNLYRLNMYPNSQNELVDGEWMHASPTAPKVGAATPTTTNAQVLPGKVYVNNGFWDTYRSAWPAISFLYPSAHVNELVDGFAQQYRDGGWIARWSSPGYADLMTGTSSDVGFAEAYMNGKLDVETAIDVYDSGLRNATVRPVNGPGYSANQVGRKGLDQSPFLGYTTTAVGQSVSWGMEGYINDYGLYNMAEKLAADPEVLAVYGPQRVADLKEEAKYLKYRSEGYINMFDPQVIQPHADGSTVQGGFAPRRADGEWDQGADLDPLHWGGAYTEGNGWTFFYHAFFDVPAMADLYDKANDGNGGNEWIVNSLKAYYSQPDLDAPTNSVGIHEAREAREVRLGQLGISNQISYHVPYVAAGAGYPQLTQEVVREINQRIFNGHDIGQGYLGDEDNGAYSSWYIFSNLGFYPLKVGSGDYTIGSPTFDEIVLNLEGGPLTIKAPGALSQGKKYIESVKLNGVPVNDVNLDGDALRAGGVLEFVMSDTPTEWGKIQPESSAPAHSIDLLNRAYGTINGVNASLYDNNSTTTQSFENGKAVVTWKSAMASSVVDSYTITSVGTTNQAAKAVLEGSNDGNQWVVVDKREGLRFRWANQTRAFIVKSPQEFAQYRLTVEAAPESVLSIGELELLGTVVAPESVLLNTVDLADVRADSTATPVMGRFIGGAGKVAADYEVSYELNDGKGPQAVNYTQDAQGFWTVRPEGGFDASEPGTYTVTIKVKDLKAEGQPVTTGTTQLSVFRDDTFVGKFSNTCLTDKGNAIGDCDGLGYQYDRSDLAADGWDRGNTVKGSDGIYYYIPDLPLGTPDNLMNEGASFYIQVPADATKLGVLAMSNEGAQTGTFVIEYSDGTTQDYALNVRDWTFFNDRPANTFSGVPGRYPGSSTTHDGKGAGIFMMPTIDLLKTNDEGEEITPVKITAPMFAASKPALRNGRMHVFAMGTDSAETTKFQGLEVEAADDVRLSLGTAFNGVIAEVVSGIVGRDIKVNVNWGDGSPIERADLGSVSEFPVDINGNHNYDKLGVYTVTVTVDDGIQSAASAMTVRVVDGSIVYNPVVKLDPATVEPGAEYTVKGSGFAAAEKVTITVGDGTPVTVTTGEDGTFDRKFTAPDEEGTVNISVVGEYSNAPRTAKLTVETFIAPPEFEVIRHSGKTRYDTSLELLKATATKGKPLFVATGASFADALAAAPAAASVGGRVALTHPRTISPEMLEFITELEPEMIFVIGGSNAVTQPVFNALANVAPVDRISGRDRFDTSLEIYDRFFAGAELNQAFVATGRSYPDALVASAAAGAVEGPVLLVNGKVTAKPQGVIQRLEQDQAKLVLIAGGKGAVSAGIQEALEESLGSDKVLRLSGTTRYDTGVEINKWIDSVLDREDVNDVFMATGRSFPDALSAAAPAGDPSARLVLSNKDCVPAAAVDAIMSYSNLKFLRLVGGTNALTDNVGKLNKCQ